MQNNNVLLLKGGKKVKKFIALFVALLFAGLVVGCGSSSSSSSVDKDPGKLVKAYYDALKADKFDQAYGYWKTSEDKAQWIQKKKDAKSGGMAFYDKVTVKKSNVQGDKATVDVNVQGMVDLTYELEKSGNAWKITNLNMGNISNGTAPSTNGTPGGTTSGTAPSINGTPGGTTNGTK